MRAAVVETVPAGGRAEIVGDDTARSEAFDFQLGKPHGKVASLIVSFAPLTPRILERLFLLIY
jgi:hypothetical protein